jgi:hypothetical protein
MKLAEFEKQIERLVKVYGANRYPRERVEMIFERVGCVDSETFKTAVSRFIGETEKAPFANDFVDALGSVLADAKKREIEAKLKLVRDCSVCNGTGHATMYCKNTGNEFAFQCTCERGPLLQPNFPKQYSSMGEEYASHRAWMAGRFDRVAVIKTNAARISGKTETSASNKTEVSGMRPLSFG